MMTPNLQLVVDFLRDLRANNNKAWFEQNRKRYETARDTFAAFVTDLMAQFGPVDDLSGVTAAECMYRINRDVRFSKDKSPYKTSMAAVLARGGRNPLPGHRSYYLHIEPDGHSILGGGLYDPTTEQLNRIRRDIAEDAQDIKKVLKDPAFMRYFGTLGGESLKTAPQGFPKDHPDIALLRLKQYLATHPLTDAQLVAPDVQTHILDAYQALKPFLTYVQSALA